MRPAVESDETLAQRALTDRDAFAELVSRYADRIFNLAYRMTGNRSEAEDMAQDAFLRAYRGLASFRPGNPFGAWLYRIAVNVCLSARRQDDPATEPIDENEAVIDPAPAVADVAEQRELQAAVQRAIVSLPPMYRAVLILYHIEDRSYEDIATLLDLPINTVRTHLHRGRAMLRERLTAGSEL
jgi:RNA polymerase sigma-70 factor, ECF subfamily